MMASIQLRDRCTGLVTSLGLAPNDGVVDVRPLTGGVASDIASVDLGDRVVCVKFALEKLRVAEDWHAPVNRNAAEYAWLDFAGDAVRGCAPRLYGRDAAHNGFAMEFVDGDDVYLWKSALLDGRPLREEAAKVGKVLGRIHAASTAEDFDSSRFRNQHDFYALRLDPYLGFTAALYPELAGNLRQLIDAQVSNAVALIHGDVSPKNILFRSGQAVFLDAECATMGDPAFDVSFCLNHLLLKAFHMPGRIDEMLGEFAAFWTSYARNVSWENVDGLERRVCSLLPALMLARIDGKSPVEYLDENDRDRVRVFAKAHLEKPPAVLRALVEAARHRVNKDHEQD